MTKEERFERWAKQQERLIQYQTGKSSAVMAQVAEMGGVMQQLGHTEKDFCPNCEFVRIMNPEGVGYCQEHGDIDPRENDPRNHTGENL